MTSSKAARATRLAIAVAAALAVTAIPALAKAPHGLALRTQGGTLAPGAILRTPGGTLAIASDKGNVECPSADLQGSLESNGMSTDVFGSSIETGSFECTSEWPTGFGASADVEVIGHQEDTITAKGKGKIEPEREHETAIRIDVDYPEAHSCEFTASKLTFRFAPGTGGHPQPVVLDVKRALKPVKPQPKGCPMMLTLTATLPLYAEKPPTLSGEYEAVESEAS